METRAEVTLEDQILCVKREIGLRKGVYRRWVKDGRMTQEKADHEIAAMEAVLVTLERLDPFDNLKKRAQQAAELLREYERYHRAKDEPGRSEKANRNGAMAWLLEDAVERLS